MFCIKICFLEPEPVGAEILQVEPEPKFFTWSRAEKKKLEPEPRKNGSAPQNWKVTKTVFFSWMLEQFQSFVLCWSW